MKFFNYRIEFAAIIIVLPRNILKYDTILQGGVMEKDIASVNVEELSNEYSALVEQVNITVDMYMTLLSKLKRGGMGPKCTSDSVERILNAYVDLVSDTLKDGAAIKKDEVILDYIKKTAKAFDGIDFGMFQLNKPCNCVDNDNAQIDGGGLGWINSGKLPDFLPPENI